MELGPERKSADYESYYAIEDPVAMKPISTSIGFLAN